MARDHQVGKGIRYRECSICARTVRETDMEEQRGQFVCPECVDESSGESE